MTTDALAARRPPSDLTELMHDLKCLSDPTLPLIGKIKLARMLGPAAVTIIAREADAATWEAVQGETYAAVAAALGVSKNRVSAAVTAHLALIGRTPDRGRHASRSSQDQQGLAWPDDLS